MLVIETAFGNKQKDLARRSLHLCVETLIQELHFIEPKNRYPIHITHTNPAEREDIMQEIEQFNHAPTPVLLPLLHRLDWLVAGQEFAV